ncbi:hypothetical protein [Methylocella sp.]|uniref:hypothetical protein n=1 Tax=Methylocella sp. TaxID=1978226 RepID=UPI0035AF66D8
MDDMIRKRLDDLLTMGGIDYKKASSFREGSDTYVWQAIHRERGKADEIEKIVFAIGPSFVPWVMKGIGPRPTPEMVRLSFERREEERAASAGLPNVEWRRGGVLSLVRATVEAVLQTMGPIGQATPAEALETVFRSTVEALLAQPGDEDPIDPVVLDQLRAEHAARKRPQGDLHGSAHDNAS